jgi:hypothetical protein
MRKNSQLQMEGGSMMQPDPYAQVDATNSSATKF